MCKGDFLASFEFPRKVINEEESTRLIDKMWRAELVNGPRLQALQTRACLGFCSATPALAQALQGLHTAGHC